MSEESPTVFGGRYELHRRLARGGMADVFLARDQLLGRPVAVKVLFPEYATDPKFVERFRREAQAAANLNHPNIVAIYDWGEEMGTYYIVMEYVEVTRVALDVAGALGFAHDGGVVHRDVKPGNVLVSPKGEMKVADFGIATAMSANADANLTQTGAVMGTATYFSPEQAQGLKVDRRSDLYSLGVLLYEMLVGEPPFTGETPVSIAYKHVQEPVVPVTEHGVDIPPALAAITMKLLSKDPDNRYPGAEALLADLNRFRQGQAIAAGAQGRIQAGGVSGPAGHQTAALPRQPIRHQDLPATYQEPPRRRGGLIAFGVLMTGLILAGFLILLQDRLETTNGSDDILVTPEVELVEIPSVGGRVEADARSTIQSRGLVVERRAQADNDIRPGQVIFTEPAAGTAVAPGTTVTLVVSSGANLKTVPSVLTKTENEALQSITSAGFQPSRQAVTSDIAPEGEVVGQTPQPGTLAEPGSVVTYEVSIGTEKLPVPDVRGQEGASARAFLESEGVIVFDEFDTATDDEIERDLVVGTIPEAGEAVAPGSELRIIISDGPEDLLMPSLLGMDKAIAFVELDGLGLVPIEFGTFVNDPALVGKVVDTVPGPNSVVTPGQQIQVLTGLLSPNAGQGNDFGLGSGDTDAGQGDDFGQDDAFDG